MDADGERELDEEEEGEIELEGEIEAEGELIGSEDEVNQVEFVSKDLLLELTGKTEKYRNGEISETDWQNSPGLEPVWYDWFKELKII